ncbi:MAG TPA: hypothetical protein VNT25_06305 [Allosphingosinicella sp.]|nr:hypothetical protein [Allosphingosinicella sp.]
MLTLLLALTAAAEPPKLRQGLEPLGFLVGHCWRGTLPKTGEKDTHCFESMYDGQHVRERHEVTGGKQVYKGETVFSWDGTAKTATFTYWNSLGGVSRGTMQPQGDVLKFGDEAYTDPQGRRITFNTTWRRIGADAYESITVSPEMPSMNKTIRYVRLKARKGR